MADVDLTAASIVVVYFVIAIFSYVAHGLLRDTTNQFERRRSRCTPA